MLKRSQIDVEKIKVRFNFHLCDTSQDPYGNGCFAFDAAYDSA